MDRARVTDSRLTGYGATGTLRAESAKRPAQRAGAHRDGGERSIDDDLSRALVRAPKQGGQAVAGRTQCRAQFLAALDANPKGGHGQAVVVVTSPVTVSSTVTAFGLPTSESTFRPDRKHSPVIFGYVEVVPAG